MSHISESITVVPPRRGERERKERAAAAAADGHVRTSVGSEGPRGINVVLN